VAGPEFVFIFLCLLEGRGVGDQLNAVKYIFVLGNFLNV
jgi:hypothetical protein